MDEPERTATAPEGGPPRRRGRTALLIGTATVLGLVAGTCTGYLVQAGRAPTKLPPLSQPVLERAGGPAPEPLSAARDRKVRTDGDLRRLLLKKPRAAEEAGWLEGADGWLDLAAYADRFGDPRWAFGDLVDKEFRRAAVTGWVTGEDHTVEIRLIQFRQTEFVAAADAVDDGRYWAEEQGDSDSWPIPGTGDGRAYVYDEPETEYGVPVYGARAHAWRGDIAMEVWVYGGKPVPKNVIMDLAERQMERL
ncbi:hypothetical protein ACLGIH_18055 [Streptomyces sp. HMX87]|uniref:hypothetical protein n=1 Tax=Streptomyces sp. HMX87 TaxID=3390849 RepID=UPI003A85CA30